MRDFVKCKKVLSFLNIFAFDIVLLQETYLGSSDFKVFKSIWKGPVFYSAAFSNHSCGVIIAFSSKLQCTYSQVRFDNEGRYVSVLCSFQDNSFRICNIYAPCNSANRVDFFNRLFYYARGRESIILGGDFNCVLNQKDKSSDSLNSTCFVGKKELCAITRSFSLVDSYLKVNPVSTGHTWFHLNKKQSSRIDRIYVEENFNIIKSVVIPFYFSDHDIVNTIIRLPNVPIVSKSYWKFNVSLF